MSPKIIIHVLPNELLESIFIIGSRILVPTDERYPHHPLVSKLSLPPLYPTSITQVCRRWRQLAIRMPSLWNNLYISRSGQSHRRLKTALGRSMDWVPSYLRLSGDFPLYITLDFTRIPIESAMSVISPHSTRWRSLTILVSHVGNLPAILPSFKSTPAPRLKYLTIAADIYREGIRSTEPLPPFFVAGTPNLSAVHLKGVYLCWNGPPLLGLTTLELRFSTRWPGFHQLKSMFEASPNLTRLIIQDDIASILRSVEYTAGQQKINLQHLRYLDIEVHRIRQTEVDVARLISIFSTPALETLALRSIRSSEWTAIVLGSKARRNSPDFPRIRRLQLIDIEGEIEPTFATCEAFPRLEHLSLVRTFSSGFLRLMLAESNPQRQRCPVLPFLQSFTINGDDSCNLTLLRDALHCRSLLRRPVLNLSLDKRYFYEREQIGAVKRYAVVKVM